MLLHAKRIIQLKERKIIAASLLIKLALADRNKYINKTTGHASSANFKTYRLLPTLVQ